VERTQQRTNKVRDRIIFPVYRSIDINELVWFGTYSAFLEKYQEEVHRLGRISKIYHKHAQQVVEYVVKNGLEMVAYDPVQIQWETTAEIESVSPQEVLIEIGTYNDKVGIKR
jgi:hypothetical protein